MRRKGNKKGEGRGEGSGCDDDEEGTLNNNITAGQEITKVFYSTTQLGIEATGIAQSISQIATGCTFRGSNPGRERYYPHPVQTGPGAHSSCYTGCIRYLYRG